MVNWLIENNNSTAMPYLSFDVDADYTELIRLQQEIAKTKSQLQNFRPGQAGASIDALNKKLAESTARYRQLAQAAIRSGADMEFGIRKNLSGIFTEVSRIQDLLTRPMMAVGGLAGVYGLGEFLTKITSIRGQFQQMNASIETMIGKRKGEKLNAELQEFAKISPLEFAPTVSTAQMMLGFGIDADKVPRYLQAIGDIAMGDTRRFQSLSLAFSQMSAAGKLMGQDLMQMVNAGFQPLQIISEKTGKSIGALKEEMSQGKISAEMVQQAFVDASSEGGKYYNMSLTASKTIPGAIAKLNDSMDLMFNDMGQNMEGALVSIIDAASTIVDNIGRIIPVLATAAAAFGVYKTSVMLSSFAAKQSVINASQSIVDGFNAELAKIQEMKNTKLMEGYDDDIRKALEKGSIDQTYADAIQQGRLWQKEQQRIAENERRIAEEAQKTYETHLKDMQTQREQAGRGLDSDLNDANAAGTLTDDTATRLQNERDYADAVVATKQAALESAEVQKRASDQLVEAANHRVESAKELMEMAEATGDATDKKAAAEEYMAAVEEQATAITAQQTAEEGVNAAQKELNGAITQQKSIQTQTATTAIVGETTATNVNTASQIANTAATSRGTIATAVATAKDKIATIAKWGLKSATDACTNAWNKLKLAAATNPFGIILTALTTVIGLFMTVNKEISDASDEVDKFGKAARKSVDEVNLFYSVLAATDKNSKVYKDTLKKLTGIAQEYGLTISSEKDEMEQLIKVRERLIELIIEEGRQRQIANNLNELQNSTDSAIADIENIAENLWIKGDRADDWKDIGKKIIAEDIDRNAEELRSLQATIESYVDAKNTVFQEFTDEDQRILDDAIAKFDKLAFGRANELAKQYGSDAISIRVSDFMGTASERDLTLIDSFTKAFADRNEKMKEYIRLQQESKEKSSEAQNAPEPYSAVEKDFASLLKDIESTKKAIEAADSALEELGEKSTKVTVDKTDADNAKESVDAATESVETHSSTEGQTNIDSTDADIARVKTEGATDELVRLDGTSAEPEIKTTWIDNFIKKVGEAWDALITFLGVEGDDKKKIAAPSVTPTKKKESEAERIKRERAAAIAQQEAAINEIYAKAQRAKTDKEFAEAKKTLNEYKSTLDRSSAEYKRATKALDELDKRDKKTSGKNKGSDDPKQRAYDAAQASIEEERRTAELLLAEQNRQYQLELDMRRESSDKEIDVIKFEAKKKREALLKARQEEADRLKKYDRQQWLKGGKGRKAYQWTQTKSDDDYLAQAGQNIGYDTQLASINFEQDNKLSDVYKEVASAMISYLKDFGTFQQKRYAIEQEYAERLLNAQNEGERLSVDAQRKSELQKLDIDALKQQIDWGSMFGDFGTMLADQVQPTIDKLEAITRTDEFRNSSFDEQKAVFELITKLKGSITKWDSDVYSTLGDAVTQYQNAMRENTQAIEAESAARQTAEDKARKLREIEEKNRQARAKGEAVDMDAETVARRESEEAIANLGTAATHTQQTTSNLANAQQNLSNATTTATNTFSQLQSGLQGLASGSLQGVWNGMNQLSKLFTGKDGLANKMGTALLKGVQKLFGDDSKIGQEVSKALSALGGPLMGEIVGIFFSILDILKDGIGNFIASLIDTVLGAVNGLLNSVLSGELVTSVGKSIIEGVGSILDTISFGGFSSVMNKLGLSGDSDKNLEKDIERLTATNEALRKAVDNLADEMRDAATADMGALYQQQKSDLEQSMKNTQEMMARSGDAYSNGFLGVGGHHSSNYKIDKGMSGDDWSRISAIVGKTINSASGFWQLTSEQMAKVAQKAPDLYAKIKGLADDGYKDAAQFMDEYIEYYKELEQLENAFRESLTDVSFDSVKDEFKSMLLDMESNSKDFANNFEKMMQQAVINSLMNSKYNEKLKEWYEAFAAAMDDKDGLTGAEQERLKRDWDNIVGEAVNDRNNLKKAMGWDSSSSQQASSRTFEGMSQDTGNAIEGRLTALQIAVESIRTHESQHTLSLADMTDELLQIAMEYSRFNVHQDNIERQLAKIYIELQTISENTGAIVKPIQTMQADIAEIKKNTKNL